MQEAYDKADYEYRVFETHDWWWKGSGESDEVYWVDYSDNDLDDKAPSVN